LREKIGWRRLIEVKPKLVAALGGQGDERLD
jgi:hypothetical protein